MLSPAISTLSVMAKFAIRPVSARALDKEFAGWPVATTLTSLVDDPPSTEGRRLLLLLLAKAAKGTALLLSITLATLHIVAKLAIASISALSLGKELARSFLLALLVAATSKWTLLLLLVAPAERIGWYTSKIT